MTFEDLPKEIQSWASSEELSNLLLDLDKRYDDKHRFTVMPGMIFRLISKQIMPGDFSQVLANELPLGEKFPPLLKELKQSALMPIKEPLLKWGIDIDLINLSPTTGGQGEKTPPPLAAPQFPKRETVSGPVLKSSEPFILHAEEEVKRAGGQDAIKPDLKRPSFYKPAFSQYADKRSTKPQSARLELGIDEKNNLGGAKEPSTVKIGGEEARVVHYSEMRTPLDPFAKIPTGGQASSPNKNREEEKKDIHPDNIVNLKDLPL